MNPKVAFQGYRTIFKARAILASSTNSWVWTYTVYAGVQKDAIVVFSAFLPSTDFPLLLEQVDFSKITAPSKLLCWGAG